MVGTRVSKLFLRRRDYSLSHNQSFFLQGPRNFCILTRQKILSPAPLCKPPRRFLIKRQYLKVCDLELFAMIFLTPLGIFIFVCIRLNQSCYNSGGEIHVTNRNCALVTLCRCQRIHPTTPTRSEGKLYR